MSTAEMIAAYLAKGGAVTQVETGARAIESDRTIYAAMRNGTRARADGDAAADAAYAKWENSVGAHHAARADGWSRDAAHDYAEHAAG